MLPNCLSVDFFVQSAIIASPDHELAHTALIVGTPIETLQGKSFVSVVMPTQYHISTALIQEFDQWFDFFVRTMFARTSPCVVHVSECITRLTLREVQTFLLGTPLGKPGTYLGHRCP